MHALENVSLIDYSNNHISLLVIEEGAQFQWKVSGIYGWPDHIHRYRTFQLLYKITPPNDNRWMCMCDFNETFWSWEKRGGNVHRTQLMEDFWEMASSLGLQDLGFSGNNITWSNRRAGLDNILVRLDRALAIP
ncbi:hypothetical protein ACS0TY_004156 [Phlomoides rotata]